MLAISYYSCVHLTPPVLHYYNLMLLKIKNGVIGYTVVSVTV